MATTMPMPADWTVPSIFGRARAHHSAASSHAAGMTSSQRPREAAKLSTAADQEPALAMSPEDERMIEAMTPRASMMNWASAMAMFTSDLTLLLPESGVNPAILSTSGSALTS